MACAGGADPRDEFMRIPLVHDSQVRVPKEPVNIELDRVVDLAAHPRVGAMKPADGVWAMVAQEIAAAPAVDRLQHANVVAAVEQFGHDTAKKVRVAVIPV